jgi:hypothetical protein
MAAKGKVRRGEIHVRVNVSTTSVSLLRASNAEARTGFLPSQKSTQDTIHSGQRNGYNSTLKTPDRRTYRTDAGILYH